MRNRHCTELEAALASQGTESLEGIYRGPHLSKDIENIHLPIHNGYLKSLKEVVHFYNTRDQFAASSCAPGTERVTCWPPPEITANLDKSIGSLGLSKKEEDQIVAFLQTLTDGFTPP